MKPAIRRNIDRPTLNICFFAIIAVLVALTDRAESQTIFGTILGTATDSTGAVIPGVKIRVTNIDTASEREAESDGQGNYEVSALLPGRYRVTAERARLSTLAA
jgi:hypothetical protein